MQPSALEDSAAASATQLYVNLRNKCTLFSKQYLRKDGFQMSVNSQLICFYCLQRLEPLKSDQQVSGKHQQINTRGLDRASCCNLDVRWIKQAQITAVSLEADFPLCVEPSDSCMTLHQYCPLGCSQGLKASFSKSAGSILSRDQYQTSDLLHIGVTCSYAAQRIL